MSLAVDPSGQRLAAVGGVHSNLYVITGQTLKPLAHNVDSAAWLPRSADVSAATTTPTSAVPATTATTVFRPASIPAKPGDVDGDGIPDTVSVSWNGSRATVVAELSRLGHQTITIAGTSRATITKFVDGHLAQATLEGQPVRLPLGGSVTHSTLIGCGAGQLIAASWSTNDEQTWAGERDVYRFTGSLFVLAGKTTHTFVTNGQPPTNTELSAAGYLQHCPPID